MTSKSVRLGLAIAGLLILSFAGNLFAQNSDKKSQAIEKEILRLEELGRQRVLDGGTNWDDLIMPNAYMIAYDGSIIRYEPGKQLPSLKTNSFTLSDLIVRVYGTDTAVVTGLADVASETPQGQKYSFKMRYINIWRKARGGWKIEVSSRTGVKEAKSTSVQSTKST